VRIGCWTEAVFPAAVLLRLPEATAPPYSTIACAAALPAARQTARPNSTSPLRHLDAAKLKAIIIVMWLPPDK